MNVISRLFICFMLLIPVVSLSQSEEPTAFLTDSSRAIQFGVSGFLNVHSFDNLGLSYKTHITPTQALRFGMSLSGQKEVQKIHEESYYGDSLTASHADNLTPAYDFTLELHGEYLWYMGGSDGLYMFAGAGPAIVLTRSEYNSGTSSSLSTGWSAGAEGSVGAEWFAFKRVSFHAEYQMSVLYKWSRYKYASSAEYNTSRTVRDNRTSSWQIQSGTVLFGLSVYF
jgi:hypothetical protein